jgi:hypothetical protein
MFFRRILLGAALLGTLWLPMQPQNARAADARDPEQRLAQIESQVLDRMREISAARVRGDNEAVERLTKQFNGLQEERVKLLRATGRLPR